MTQQEWAKEIQPTVQAMIEGKKIQKTARGTNNWYEHGGCHLSDSFEYREAPVTVYRPYTPEEALKYLVGKKIYYVSVLGEVSTIPSRIKVVSNTVAYHYDGHMTSLRKMLVFYIFEDGTPCGIPVEEASGS